MLTWTTQATQCFAALWKRQHRPEAPLLCEQHPGNAAVRTRKLSQLMFWQKCWSPVPAIEWSIFAIANTSVGQFDPGNPDANAQDWSRGIFGAWAALRLSD